MNTKQRERAMRGCLVTTTVVAFTVLLSGSLPGCPKEHEGNEELTATTAPSSEIPIKSVSSASNTAKPAFGLASHGPFIEPQVRHEGDRIVVRSQPLSFKTACEGVASVKLSQDGETLSARWSPKLVEPDAVCAQMMHEESAVVEFESLPEGLYKLHFEPSGGNLSFNVLPKESAAPASGAKP